MIGNENLPNVYIDKIMLFTDGDRTRVEVALAMYDREISHLWLNRTKTADLKIKVRLSQNSEEIKSLDSGDLSLFNFDLDDSTKALSINAGTQAENQIAGTIKRQYLVSFYISSNDNPIELNVYASCFLDFNGFPGNKEFNKYYGPMAAESIFKAGSLNDTSIYFLYEGTDQEHMGPVHQHPDGRWMEGSMHSVKPHRLLEYQEEENFKIIDNRE